jgi:hypothetical protein
MYSFFPEREDFISLLLPVVMVLMLLLTLPLFLSSFSSAALLFSLWD